MKKTLTKTAVAISCALAVAACGESNVPPESNPGFNLVVEPSVINADEGNALIIAEAVDVDFTGAPYLFTSVGKIGPINQVDEGRWEAEITELRDASRTAIVTALFNRTEVSSSITIDPGACDSFEIDLEDVFVNADGGASSLPAILTDSWGNPVTGQTLKTTTNMGRSFTREKGDGLYRIFISDVFEYLDEDILLSIKAFCGPGGTPIKESTTIPLLKGRVTKYSFSPIAAHQAVNKPFHVEITALDKHENHISSARGVLKLRDDYGFIRPRVTPPLVNGKTVVDMYFTGPSTDAYNVIRAIDVNRMVGKSTPIQVSNVEAGALTIVPQMADLEVDYGRLYIDVFLTDKENGMPLAGQPIVLVAEHGTVGKVVDNTNGSYKVLIDDLTDTSYSPVEIFAELDQTCYKCPTLSATTSFRLEAGAFDHFVIDEMPTMRAGSIYSSTKSLLPSNVFAAIELLGLSIAYIIPIRIEAQDQYDNILTRWSGRNVDGKTGADLKFRDISGEIQMVDLLNFPITFTSSVELAPTAGVALLDDFQFQTEYENNQMVAEYKGLDFTVIPPRKTGSKLTYGSEFNVINLEDTDARYFNKFLVGTNFRVEGCLDLSGCEALVDPIPSVDSGVPIDTEIFIVPVHREFSLLAVGMVDRPLDVDTANFAELGIEIYLSNGLGEASYLEPNRITQFHKDNGDVLNPLDSALVASVSGLVINEEGILYSIRAFGGGADGLSNSFVVYGTGFSEIRIDNISNPQYVGEPFVITAAALDGAGEVITDFNRTVLIYHSALGSPLTLLPATFNNGLLSRSITISEEVDGHIELRAAFDSSSIMGVSNNFSVTSGWLDHFEFTLDSVQYVDSPVQVEIIAKDSKNYVLSTYSSAIDVESSCGAVQVLDETVWSEGSKIVTISFDEKCSNAVLTVSALSISTDSEPFTIYQPSNLDAFKFKWIPGENKACVDFAIKVTALDPDGSTLTDFSIPVQLSDNTGTILPKVSAPFVSGVLNQTVSICGAESSGNWIGVFSANPTVQAQSNLFNLGDSEIVFEVASINNDTKYKGEWFELEVNARKMLTGEMITGFTRTVNVSTSNPAIFACASPVITVRETSSQKTGPFTDGAWRGEVKIDTTSANVCRVNINVSGADSKSGSTFPAITLSSP